MDTSISSEYPEELGELAARSPAWVIRYKPYCVASANYLGVLFSERKFIPKQSRVNLNGVMHASWRSIALRHPEPAVT